MTIRELREAAHLAQNELATKLQLPQSTLSQYETGARRIELDAAKKLASFFNVTLDEIYGYTPNTKKAPGAKAGSNKDIAMEALRSLPPEGQKDAADYLRYLLTKYKVHPKSDAPKE